MIQHITKTHLDMLTDTGRERLWKYYRTIHPRSEERYDKQGFPIIHIDEEKLKQIGLSPEFFSIGQLIQFLEEQGGSVCLSKWGEGWSVTWRNNLYVAPAFHEEPIDALWNAAVTILNRPKEVK